MQHSVIGKVWGTTQLLYQTALCELHRLVIVARGHSSWHHHHTKSNFFYLESGLVRIQTKEDIGPDGKPHPELEQQEVLLRPGDVTEVDAGVIHRFIAVKPSVLLEIYSVALEADDIIRHDCGGVMKLRGPRSLRRRHGK